MVFKVIKKAVKGIGKVFKKVGKFAKRLWNNKIFRAVLIAAAVTWGVGALANANAAAGATGAAGSSAPATLAGEVVGPAAIEGGAAAGAAGGTGAAASGATAAEAAAAAAGNASAAGGTAAQVTNAGLQASTQGITETVKAGIMKPTTLTEGFKTAEQLNQIGTLAEAGKATSTLGKIGGTIVDGAKALIPESASGKLMAGLMVGNGVNSYFSGKAAEELAKEERKERDRRNAEWGALGDSGDLNNFDYSPGSNLQARNDQLTRRGNETQNKYGYTPYQYRS